MPFSARKVIQRRMIHPSNPSDLQTTRNQFLTRLVAAVLLCLLLVWLSWTAHNYFKGHQEEVGAWWGFAYLIIGGILLSLMPALPTHLRGSAAFQVKLARGWRLHVGLVGILLGLGLLVWSYVRFAEAEPPHEMLGRMTWNLYFGGLALFFGGALSAIEGKFQLSRPEVPRLLLIILALGFLLRVHDLSRQPLGIWIDEANNGYAAQRVITEPGYRPLFIPYVNSAGPHIFLYALFLQLFGFTSIEGIRLMAVLFSLGAILLAYLIGNQLHGQKFGLLMAIFLMASRWLINFSRIAMPGIDSLFLVLLGVYCLIRFWQSGRWRDALWLGLTLGISTWFYQGNRAGMAVVMGFVVLTCLVHDWQRRRLISLQSIILLGTIIASFILIFFPWIIYQRENPDLYTFRIEQVSLFSSPSNRADYSVPEALWISFGRYLRMFHIYGDRNGRHNFPAAPMLDPITGALFVMGAVVALRRWRRETWLFAAVFAAALASGAVTLLWEAPNSLRVLPALGAVVYFCALGALTLGNAIKRLLKDEMLGSLKTPIWGISSFALMLALVFLNGRIYFNEQRTNPMVWSSFTVEPTLMGRIAARLDENTRVVASRYMITTPLAFAWKDHERMETLPMPNQLPLPFPPDRPAVLFFLLEETRVYDDLRRLYPNVKITGVRASEYGVEDSIWNKDLFYYAECQPIDIAQLQGVDENGDGILYIPLYGDYQFIFTPHVRLTIGGVPIKTSTPYRLPEGNNTIHIEGEGAIYWRRPDQPDTQPLPEYLITHAPNNNHGLLVTFWNNEKWQGEPLTERVDPNVDRFYSLVPWAPYSAAWTGQLLVPRTGVYQLGVETNQPSELWIDGQQVVITSSAEAWVALPLRAGAHDLELRLAVHEGGAPITLYWALGDGSDRNIIPRWALRPAPARYATQPQP